MGSLGLVTVSSKYPREQQSPELETLSTKLIFLTAVTLSLQLWGSYLVMKNGNDKAVLFLRTLMVLSIFVE